MRQVLVARERGQGTSTADKGVQDSSPPGASTPASHTPTPLSATFRDSGSMAHPTPTPGTGTKGANKSKKKEAEESERDSQSNKKRTNFGASRK